MDPRKIGISVVKFIFILVSLYFFICSLTFLSESFRLLGGKNIGGTHQYFTSIYYYENLCVSAFFEDTSLLQNPVVGVMIGIIVTVLVQSSSTSTSIIVSLVSTGLPVKTAIPMVMGANIGTSVTNTIVSFTQMGNREEFRRAFAAATVHDMFNWLAVILLVLVETVSGSFGGQGYLEYVTDKMVQGLRNEDKNTTASKPPDFLKVITNPFTKSIVQLDKKILKGWAANDPDYDNVTSVLKTHCGEDECSYLFYGLSEDKASIGDVGAGLILLTVALLMLCGCLVGLVKLLNSLLGKWSQYLKFNFINMQHATPL